MKKIGIIIGIVIAVLITISIFKDVAIKFSVEKGTQMVTGLKLGIRSFRVGLINTRVVIGGLKLYNPKGFKDRVMLDMPEVYVDYNLGNTLKGTIHLEEVRINIKEFTVVKNEKGELNIDSLKVVKAEKEGKRPEQTTKQNAPDIQIDKLELKIGKVYYKDYSQGGEPVVQEYNVDVNEKYTNITDPYALVSIIVSTTLMKTSIARLTGFDLNDLKGTVSDKLSEGEKVAAQTIKKAKEAAKQVKDLFTSTFGGSEK